MANPPKKKGTGGENEVRMLLNEEGVRGLLRTSPGQNYDLVRVGNEPPLQLLFTRPDRGRWLVSLDARAFARLLVNGKGYPRIEAEVKRYARFSLHTIFENKFREG